MKQITISSSTGVERYDIEALDLDGRPAHLLPRDKLHRRLVELKIVPGNSMAGSQDLLVQYARHLAVNKPAPPVHKRTDVGDAA